MLGQRTAPGQEVDEKTKDHAVDVRLGVSEALSNSQRQDQSHEKSQVVFEGKSRKRQRIDNTSGPVKEVTRSKNTSNSCKSVATLEQVSRRVSESVSNQVENHAVRPTHLSIFRPLDAAESYTSGQYRPLPDWMAKLPSNRSSNYSTAPPTVRHSSTTTLLPSHLASIQDLTVLEPLSKPSTSFYEQIQRPAPLPPKFSTAVPKVATFTSSIQPPSVKPTKQLSSFLFSHNPKANLTAAAESASVSPTSSPVSSPLGRYQTSGPPVVSAIRRERKSSFQSGEFLIKYHSQIFPEPEISVELCPICEEPIETPVQSSEEEVLQLEAKLTVTASNSLTYHESCLVCRSCMQPFLPTSNIEDWTFVGFSSPYHRSCMNQAAKPMFERLKRKLSLHAEFHQQQKWKRSPAMLPGLSRPVSISTASPTVSNKSQRKRSNSKAIHYPRTIRFQPSLTSLFSTRQVSLAPSPTSLTVLEQSSLDSSSSSSLPLVPPQCDFCGRSVAVHLEGSTDHLFSCLRYCGNCGRDLQGLGGGRFEWDEGRRMRGICESCWLGRENREGIESKDQKVLEEELGTAVGDVMFQGK